MREGRASSDKGGSQKRVVTGVAGERGSLPQLSEERVEESGRHATPSRGAAGVNCAAPELLH